MKNIALSITLILAFGCSSPTAQKSPPPVVTATKAITMDVPIYHDYIGHGDANSTVDIYPQISGRLTAQKYTGGELVRAGDPLFTIDSRAYVAAYKKAMSELEKNTASLRFAKEKAETYTELIKDDIVSQLDFDQSLTDVLTLDAQIEENKADIELANLNIQWSTVRAPITGIASLSSVGVGTYVTAGGSTPLVSIKQSIPLSLNIYIPEAHYLTIRKLKSQGPVRVQAYSDQDKERVYEGTLNLIDNSMDQQTGTIWMQATFPNQDATMWPSEYFLARVHMGIATNSTVIPLECIVKTQKGNQIYVINKGNVVEERSVTLGYTYRNLTIVKAGVSPGDIIVLKGQINLSPGVQVVIKGNKITPIEEIQKESPEAPTL